MQFIDRIKSVLLGKPQTANYTPPAADIWGQSPRDLPIFNFNSIRMMLWDPTIKLGLAMREAPLCNAQFAYREGDDWTSGIKADRPDVAEFVLQQLQRLWRFDLHKILKAQVWGWCGAEILYKLNPKTGMVEFDGLLTRHAADSRALHFDGFRLAGVRFRHVNTGSNGHIDVIGGKSFWHAFMPEDGSFYGHGILRGPYSSWADKWFDGMALDVRRLFAHKDAYGGVDMGYPGGKTEVNGVDVPNQDVARMIAEQIKAGGVTTRPSECDPMTGKERWPLTRATIPASPTHIFEYPKDLDVEMLRGMEIPDDVLTSENGGAWEGKKVPAQAFFTGLNKWGNLLLGDVVKQIIEPLVWLNWGRAEEFEATLKPLGLQSGQEQQGDKPNGGQGGGFNPFAPQAGGFGGGEGGGRMQMGLGGIDPETAVGMGVLSAAELVKAARIAMSGPLRMGAEFKEGEHPRDEEGEFIAKQLSGAAGAATKLAANDGNIDAAGHALHKAARVAHSAAAKHIESLVLKYEADGDGERSAAAIKLAERHRYFEKLHAGNMRYIATKLKQLE